MSTKTKKKKPSDKSSSGPRVIRRLARPLGWALVTVTIAAVAALGFSVLEGRVLTGLAGGAPTEVRAQIVSRPEWMPEALASQIAAELIPPGARYFDLDLTDRVRSRAAANPWVGQVLRVTKRRSDEPNVAVIDLDAVFRMPVAKTKATWGFAYIDAEGFRLPADQVPQWAGNTLEDTTGQTFYLSRQDVPHSRRLSRIHYMIISGAGSPLPAVGQKWQGHDVSAGLELVKLVATKPYAYQVTEIDVRNFGGRIDPAEPHLRMWAQAGRSHRTDIRFGRFPMPGGDYVVSPQRKMSYLDEYVEDHSGHLAGVNRYLDLRYDELHVSVN